MFLTIILALIVGGVMQGQIATPGYGGPAVSSRGLRDAGARGGEPTNIRLYGTVRGVVDNGFIGVGLDQNGNITDPGTLFGVEANVGAYGTREWKRSRLGLDYQGSVRHYSSKTFYDGSDHMLSLDYGTQITRRTGAIFKIVAGTSTLPVGGVFSYGSLDPFFLGVPINDVFNNRSYFLEAMGAYTIQIGARNSLNVGGSGFAVRRQSKVLVGVNGQRAFSEFSRQVSRRTVVGVSYQYFHVDYPRVFGEADVNSVSVTLRRQLNRYWTFTVGAGGMKTDFAGVRQVTLDPVIQELLGQTTGREAFNAVNYTPVVQVMIDRRSKHNGVSLNYSRGASPGNGVLLLSRMESATAGYTYNSGDRWSASATASYYKTSGFGGYFGTFTTVGGGAMFNYRFWRDLNFSASVDVRRLNVTTSSFRRVGSRVTAGITYSPGAIPVSFR